MWSQETPTSEKPLPDLGSYQAKLLVAQKLLEDRRTTDEVVLQVLQQAMSIDSEAKAARDEANALTAQVNELQAQLHQARTTAQAEVEATRTQLQEAVSCVEAAHQKLLDVISLGLDISSRCSSLAEHFGMPKPEVHPQEQTSALNDGIDQKHADGAVTEHTTSASGNTSPAATESPVGPVPAGEVGNPSGETSEGSLTPDAQRDAALGWLKTVEALTNPSKLPTEGGPSPAESFKETTPPQALDTGLPTPESAGDPQTAKWSTEIGELSPGTFWVRPTPGSEPPKSGTGAAEQGKNIRQP